MRENENRKSKEKRMKTKNPKINSSGIKFEGNIFKGKMRATFLMKKNLQIEENKFQSCSYFVCLIFAEISLDIDWIRTTKSLQFTNKKYRYEKNNDR